MNQGKILVIDDNPDIAEIVCAMAESLGMSCMAAGDSRSAASGLALDPRLIVMDLLMPEMSGTELMKQLAVQGCRSKLVLMSGVGPVALRLAEELGKSLGLNVVGSLAKPFRGAELRAILMR